MHSVARTFVRLTALTVSTCLVAACGSDAGNEYQKASTEVTVVTHDSFALDPALEKKFETDSGLDLNIVKQGDVGTLVNKLVLTKDSPLADAVYGIDNTFASRAVDEGVIAEYDAPSGPGQDEFDLEFPGLNPVDYSDVCVNVDDTWFAKNSVATPKTLDDLTKPRYRGLLAIPGANTSSPGLAFLLATIGAKGDDWKGYWEDLLANDVAITSGWTEAYEGEFTQGGGQGTRPIVVSYSSSPPFTVPEEGGKPTTSALLDTCFRQVEYAAVLDGAANEDGAQQFVDFMMSPEVQASLPESMYVYPTRSDVELPEAWAQFAPPAQEPWSVPAEEIAENRTAWLREWRDIATK